MSDTKDVFESERARLDKKYKELTNNRVKNFVKQAGSTDAARDVSDIFVSDLEKFKSDAHINKMARLKEHQNHLSLGDRTRFGDGDGSWWDRWLTQKPPEISSLRSGTTVPKCGFKRHHPRRFQIENEKHTTDQGDENIDENTEGGFDDNNSNDGNEEKITKTTSTIEVRPMEGTLVIIHIYFNNNNNNTYGLTHSHSHTHTHTHTHRYGETQSSSI